MIILKFYTLALLLITKNTWAQVDDLDEEDDDDFVPFVGDRKDKFDWALCSMLDERQPGNVIASPMSVKLLLGMIYEGSTGPTARELEDILQLSPSRSTTRYLNSATIKSLQTSNSKFDLKISSRMFLDRSVVAKNWYKRILALYYETYVENLDFDKPLMAINDINHWVHVATRGQIHKLISDPGSLADSKFVLVNAVFFSSLWKNPFSPSTNFHGNFQTPAGPENVVYMTQTGLFYYSESDELRSKLLRLPYKGQKFSMYIILPNEPGGLNLLLKQINPFVLRRHISQLEQTSVSVTIPLFSFDFTMNLNDMLQELGITGIYSNFDDMRGIIKSKRHKGIVVSKIIQKASIKVTESGTEAAAASGVEFVNKFSVTEVDFNATHPFLFFIEDDSTGTVIFVGKLVYPQIKLATFQMENEWGNENITATESIIPDGTTEADRSLQTDLNQMWNELFKNNPAATEQVKGKSKGLLDGSPWETSRSP